MSFTAEVKTEICKNELLACCKKAQLASLLQMCSTLTLSDQLWHLQINSQNPTVAKRILAMMKQLYKVDTQLSMIKQIKFNKRYNYEIKVFNDARLILEDLTLWGSEGLNHHPLAKLVKKDCCCRAYLAGAFLAGGSVNSPRSSNYHWEINCQESELADFVTKLLVRYEINTKKILRRNKNIIYLKLSEKIGDFLRLVGAYESLMKFEDARIQRDYMNSISRLDNCDIANEMKAQASAARQFADIELLVKHHGSENIETRLWEVGELRLANPEVSYNELCLLFERKHPQGISKSGMRHRFNKIHELANRIRNNS